MGKWENWEIEVLHKWYGKDNSRVYSLLQDRTRDQIYDKVKSLKISRKELLWSDEELEFLKSNYKDIPVKELADIMGRTKSSIYNKIRRGLVNYKPKRKYHFDRNLFSKDYLQSPDEACLLGYIYADGSVSRGRLQLALHKKDHQYLMQIQDFIKTNAPIFELSTMPTMKYLTIGSVDLVKNLNRFGVFENKSLTLKYPSQEILNGYEKDFIRGYFEGDGSVSYGYAYSKGKTERKCHFSFIGTYDMMFNIRKFFDNNTNANHVKILNHDNVFTIEYGGRRQVPTLGYFLYKEVLNDKRRIFMIRKLDIFTEMYKDYFLH